ncbi:hypothetical protein BIW11_12981 [Tropilaelaps mercedesae]|uniref:Tudor domain-containing protein n=1 Tax=Tropilaelaps mercedesae TaxID=418985 RepID=A0A1V9X4N5_9ACAR|nr:hypothetical protein BIW11_12981 [Tropilaelaps mercedesae]
MKLGERCAYSEASADEAGRLDSGIGSPKGTPQINKNRLSLGNQLEALHQSTPATKLVEESLSAVCYSSSPLPLANDSKSSSMHVEVSTLSFSEADFSSDAVQESGITINSLESPSVDVSLICEENAHVEDSRATPSPADLSSTELTQPPAAKKGCDLAVEKSLELDQPKVPEMTNGGLTATPLKDSAEPVTAHNKNNVTLDVEVNVSNQKPGNTAACADGNSICKSLGSPELQRNSKACQGTDDQIPPESNRKDKDSNESQLHSGKTNIPSGKRKGVNALPSQSGAQSRRLAGSSTHGEGKYNGTDPRRHSSGSEATADDKSEGSADSGKGGSDCPVPPAVTPTVFEFELPSELCGRLIGREGCTVKSLKNSTGATITVRAHLTQQNLKTVYVIGAAGDVEAALQGIRKIFPRKMYPQVSLQSPPPLQIVQLPPDAGAIEVRVCAIEAANQVFVQLMKNNHVLCEIQEKLALLYGPESIINAPLLGVPCPGSLCVSVQNPAAYRALVMGVSGSDLVSVKYVDAGGYGFVRLTDLKQIRSDMLRYPLQAVEVAVANIEPAAGVVFTPEAMNATHRFVEGVQNDGRLFARVVSYEGDKACVDLIGHMPDQIVSLSEHLVQGGHARWVTRRTWNQPRNEGTSNAATGDPFSTFTSAPVFSPADFPQLNAASQNGAW